MSPSAIATASNDITGGVKAVQQLEGGMIAALSITATLVIDPSLWWVPLATFLLFDLSMLGYVRSPAAGAIGYMDRMLGYGLKLPGAFEHTHLGWIGPRTPTSSTARS